ncbi:MAG: 1,4-dihydroxy-6-naphthoate synthase [Chitinophagaceae bacterium]|nr:MAG: 1,4-dihydroxy-6-naphthoate synthase [Chitinophagaceae bacterium]
MKFTIGFSPCPNDTFIFDALVNKKVDTEGIDFETFLEDVQTLNQWAIEGRLDITKLSYGVLPKVVSHYKLLDSGGALGLGVGPLLVGRHAENAQPVEQSLIAIPGENTTAHLLFSLKYPNALNKVFIRYDEVENFVLSGKGLGVIIHENRFTYKEKGLHKIADLGDYWEQQTQVPIPLGGIVIKKQIEPALQKQVEQLIRKSIEFAFSNYPNLNDYIRVHSQEMSEEVMRKHIDLYVNNFSLSLGDKGRTAVQALMNVYGSMHAGDTMPDDFFL